MKNLLAFAFLFITASNGASAQVQRNTDSSQARVAYNNRDEKKQTMQSLNLTKEQKGQLKELRQSQKQQKQAVMDEQNLSDMQRRQKLKEIRREQNARLRTILSPEQMNQLMQQRTRDKIMKPGLEDQLTNSKQKPDSVK